MRTGDERRVCLALFLLTLATTLACPAAAQDRIGNASALSNRVEGLIGGDARVLQVGSEVFQNELVRTGDASVVQLVFLDNTDLRVGPKSEVTLDRFVYDPASGAGAVVVKTGLGIFRFITGSQRSQNYLIQTPIASIGVRGTVFDLLVQGDRMTVILRSGRIQVTALQGRFVVLTQPDTSVTIYADGRIEGPRAWRGTVHVDFANAPFPYFEPTQPTPQPILNKPQPSLPVKPSVLPVKPYIPVNKPPDYIPTHKWKKHIDDTHKKKHVDDYKPKWKKRHVNIYTPQSTHKQSGNKQSGHKQSGNKQSNYKKSSGSKSRWHH